MKKKIKDIIIKQKRYHDPDYSAKALAEELGISIFQLARLLKKEFGKSYADLVLELRINEAKKHLKNKKKDGLLIEEIGILVGFRNKWSFFQAFRKFTGTTPGEWKITNRED